MITLSENIEQLPISALVPYARNSRTHSEQQIKQIANSIKEFGFTNPVLIDADGGIIAGHGRVMAATQLNLTQVPCIRLTHLTDAQKRAYVIADNQLALNAGWDDDLLRAELHDLDALGFDVDLLGFDDGFLGGEDPVRSVSGGSSDTGIEYKESYSLVIVCKDAHHQEEHYDKLVKMGYTVKVLVN